MTIEQCYSAIESNYEEVLGRFAGNKMLVEKFARKFLDDPSYQTLVDTMDKADYEEAFRAAHTLKGVCANLGFTQLFKVSSDLTEELRGGAPDEAKLPELNVIYKKADLLFPLLESGSAFGAFYVLFFCYVFQTLIHDGCHVAVCQGVEDCFSISSKFDQ